MTCIRWFRPSGRPGRSRLQLIGGRRVAVQPPPTERTPPSRAAPAIAPGPRRSPGPARRRSCPPSRRRSATRWSPASRRPAATSGPNLGCVELTIALHRVFDSPREPIVFDTGHQAYVHKMLTGRVEGFERLRQRGGLSGYPSRAESEHDWVENSHASTSLSYADGLAKAFAVRGDSRPVVAVVGDGALTGGMAWEALNNIAAAQDRPVDHRRQRQRPLLLADHRRRRRRAGHPAPAPGLRGRAERRPPGAAPRAGRRHGAVRRAARDQEGPQGRPVAAGHVRGPRPEVRRPGRRARHRGDGVRAAPRPRPSAGR